MPDRKLAISHTTGNQNVREVLTSLAEADLLERYTTSFGVTRPPRLLPGRIRRAALKRSYPMLASSQLHSSPWRELLRQAARAVPVRKIRAATDTGRALGPQWVADGLDAVVARGLDRRLPAVYGYLGQAAKTFHRARDLGIKTFLEAHHAAMPATLTAFEKERARSPEWASTIPDLSGFELHGLAEIGLADVVISPSNQVTASVLQERADARVFRVPYGCPPVPPGAVPISWDGSGPLKLLFVGRLQAVKGLADVDRLRRTLGPAVHLTVVGQRPGVECRALDDLLAESDYRGTLPRSEVLALMREHHALVLPSLIEGRSLAVLEALSQGLPVLTTPGTGTDDIVGEGGGHVVAVADPEALIAATSDLLDDPSLIEQMSGQALNSAAASGWTVFRNELTSVITRELETR